LKGSLTVVLLSAPALMVLALAHTSPQQTPQANASGAQTAPKAAPAPPAARHFAPAYPVRLAADPAMAQHGKQLFAAKCGFCHGSDARGGESGPNLIRSQLVLDDRHGELIAPVIHDGRIALGMPKFKMADGDISDIVAFLHNEPRKDRGAAPSAPINIVVGDAKAGEAYFNGPGKCSTCHSVSGDLAGIGSRYEPKTLQNLVVSGGGGRRRNIDSHATPITVTVTVGSGQKYEGKLDHLDAFDVALTGSDGVYRSFAIKGSTPKVEVHNPLQPHLDMLPNFKDADIHNLTAYLVTVK
jgi:cytochrome c oxidase cbb3-type subunit 3